MKRFQNNVLSKEVAAAIKIAEELFKPESLMMLELKEKDDFKYNSGSGIEVYNKILACTVVAPIFTYRPKFPWSKAMGYSDGKAIYLNLRKLDSFSLPELVGLLCHEASHIYGFGHSNNFITQEKLLYSVPYFLSEGVPRWI